MLRGRRSIAADRHGATGPPGSVAHPIEQASECRQAWVGSSMAQSQLPTSMCRPQPGQRPGQSGRQSGCIGSLRTSSSCSDRRSGRSDAARRSCKRRLVRRRRLRAARRVCGVDGRQELLGEIEADRLDERVQAARAGASHGSIDRAPQQDPAIGALQPELPSIGPASSTSAPSERYRSRRATSRVAPGASWSMPATLKTITTRWRTPVASGSTSTCGESPSAAARCGGR